jgi:hypothetical protein
VRHGDRWGRDDRFDPISSALTLALIGGIWLVVLGVMQIATGLRSRATRLILADARELRAILSRGVDPPTPAAPAFRLLLGTCVTAPA